MKRRDILAELESALNEGKGDVAKQLEFIVKRFGGYAIYIPKNIEAENEIRNSQMLKEFNGSNYQELSRKYGISERHVRLVLHKQKKETESV
jgi:Mor family transcriptional regulator